jgi:hypothetical protein
MQQVSAVQAAAAAAAARDAGSLGQAQVCQERCMKQKRIHN